MNKARRVAGHHALLALTVYIPFNPHSTLTMCPHETYAPCIHSIQSSFNPHHVPSRYIRALYTFHSILIQPSHYTYAPCIHSIQSSFNPHHVPSLYICARLSLVGGRRRRHSNTNRHSHISSDAGMKSYGRGSAFLLRIGHEQVQHVLKLMGDANPSEKAGAAL